jgi:hypothetical protein
MVVPLIGLEAYFNVIPSLGHNSLDEHITRAVAISLQYEHCNSDMIVTTKYETEQIGQAGKCT